MPTSELSDPYAVVDAAIAAQLQQGEEALEALYDDHGERLCHLAFGRMWTASRGRKGCRV